MSSNNPNDPNDPANQPVPASATGMFSASPSESHRPQELEVDDFFAQFRAPELQSPAVSAPQAAIPEAPAQVPVVVPVPPPAFAAPPVPSGASSSVFVNTPIPPQALEPAKPAARLETPQLQEVFIKTGKVRKILPPEPAELPHDFTRVFRASDILAAAAASRQPPAPPVAAVLSPEVKPIEAVQDKASFTQLLRAITDEKPAPAAQAQAAPPIPPPPPIQVESITQILERLDRPKNPPPPMPPVPVPQAVAVPAYVPAATAPAAKPVVPEPVVQEAAAVEIKKEPAPSFTQFMAGFTPGQAPPAAAAPPVMPLAQTPTPGGSAPGSFTQIMSGLGTSAPPAGPVEPSQQPPAALPARPGSMTQLLQSLDKPRAAEARAEPWQPLQTPPAAPPSSPGGFTQFFQKPASAPLAPPPDANPFNAPGQSQPEPSMQGGSFTRLMQALDQPTQPRAGTPNDPALRGLMSQDAPSATAFPSSNQPGSPFGDQGLNAASAGLAGPGNFTRLMQTLDGPRAPISSAPQPPAATGGSGVPGGATSIFATPAPAVAAPVTPAGPSEFTQILSGSALRDARAKATAMPPGPPPAPIVPGPMQMPGFSMPAMQMPHAPQAPPMAMPGMPMPQMQMPQMQMPQMQMPQPPAPPAAPQKSKLQQYLPLMLIGAVLLIVVLVVVLFFVLHGHK